MDTERARSLLTAERSRIEHELAALTANGPLEGSDQREPGDRDSEDLYMDELNLSRRETLRTELAAVARAEARLDAGTYGRSADSGESIPDARLEAIPTAERTLEEQERYERG
jgi:DnaK suppressor protein